MEQLVGRNKPNQINLETMGKCQTAITNIVVRYGCSGAHSENRHANRMRGTIRQHVIHSERSYEMLSDFLQSNIVCKVLQVCTC